MRYPINCDTLYLGGILTSIWMWSGHASASIISTPLYSHNFLIILPISDFICPYITCLRYFGANTIWYLQFHLVCAKLSVSSFFFNTGIPPLILCDVVGKPSLLYLRRFIFSTHRHSLFGATGIARGCLLQSKKGAVKKAPQKSRLCRKVQPAKIFIEKRLDQWKIQPFCSIINLLKP